MNQTRGWRGIVARRIVAGAVLTIGCTVLTGCGLVTGLYAHLSGGSAAANGSATNGSAVNTSSAIRSTSQSTSTSAQNAKSTGGALSPFAGGTFDPQNLFNVYDDQISVTESNGTVFVAWESYEHGNMVYTSIAKNGHWVAQDVPVYSLASLSSNGNWSKYLSGNCLIVVNRFVNNTFIVKWGADGRVTQHSVLYKGWVGGDFAIRSGDELALALHLPYGAPASGARYNLYFPDAPSHPLIVTTNAAAFTGALYAFDKGNSRLVEARHVKNGAPVLDVYKLGTGTGAGDSGGTSAASGQAVLANTLPVVQANGKPLQVDLKTFPDAVAIDGQGTVYTISRTAPDTVEVITYDESLKETHAWPHIQITNRYAQNAVLTVASGTPHVWDVYEYNGLAELQEVQLGG